ncbi:MAG: hypothetical protein ACRD4Q_00075 [Candidatus Acidiferrales bacterium]
MVASAELAKPGYEGLNASSVALWRQFLGYYADQFSSFDYNVRVGQGIQAPAYLSDAEKQLWKMLTQKRIDVLADRLDETWIIEIVERPGLASIGQLIGYRHLVEEYLPHKPRIVLALLCARLGHDMGLIFQKQGVVVFYFPLGKSPSFPPQFLPTGYSPAVSG